jgi:hypothetical protein
MAELALRGEAREVALAEVQTVRSLARDASMRERLDALEQAIGGEGVPDDGAELLESVLELGLQTGRIRAYYGPGGEQAALKTLRRLPRGRLRAESADEVTAALRALEGSTLEGVRIAAVAPGAFTLSIDAAGVQLAVRLDAGGARVVSAGT